MRVVVSAFEAEDRSIWKQRVPLAPNEAASLAALLEAAVSEKKRYSYEPAHANCTTEIRDLLDLALHGELRARAGPADSPRYREMMEEGFRGKPLELAGIALLVGWPGEAKPTAWEQMFLPLRLRDGVERLGAKPEVLHARGGFVLPTSTAAGRGMLIFLGAIAAAAIFFIGRRNATRLYLSLGVVGVFLGAVALLVDAMAVVTVFPWVTRNLVLLVLLPTDLALFRMPGGLERYLTFRLALAVVALVLSAVVGQPLVAVALFAGLPLGTALLLERRLRKA